MVVPTFTNAHISDQAMQSLISIGEHHAEGPENAPVYAPLRGGLLSRVIYLINRYN
ncbi:MAG: hypothetical protein FalmKO_47290 [Falsiruegeria mediterranea]